MEDEEVNPMNPERWASVRKGNLGDSVLKNELFQLRIGLPVGANAARPELPDGEMGDNEAQALQMVRVRMGENEVINVLNFPLPQERGDDTSPRIEPIVVRTPSIDEHLLPSWKFDQDGIAVPHVEKREPEVSLEVIPDLPIGEMNQQGEKEPKGQGPRPATLCKVRNEKQEEVEEDDLESGGG